MDLTINNSTVKTPEAESETPTRIQPIVKPFTNGVLKRHAPPYLHHHHPVVITYKECLKNHAATLGGHAVDGCGEFMPAPASNPSDPTSLKCAACGCHRNFHRREPDDQTLQLPAPNSLPALEYQPLHRHHPPMPRGNNSNNSTSPNNSPSPPPISSAYYPSAPHMLLALSHGPASAPAAEGAVPAPGTGGGAGSGTQIFTNSGSGRKRFRTKFSSEQKEKMLEFADRVGWKMQKRDEDLISGFCGEIGVDKGVFKVWMHNNKNNFGKKDLQDTPPPSLLPNGNHNGIAVSSTTTPAPVGINGSSGGIGYGYAGNREVKENNFHGLEIGGHHPHHNHHQHQHQHVLGTTNGSSSSS